MTYNLHRHSTISKIIFSEYMWKKITNAEIVFNVLNSICISLHHSILLTDYMQPQMEEIFSNKTFQAFKEYADPVLITDYLWAKHIITERQFQEIKAYTSDIGKAEYLWLLIKRERYYLDAIRKASMDTNQGQIAALLECTNRCVCIPSSLT